MARRHPRPTARIRRLRPDPIRFAAAAALHDPLLMLQPRVAQVGAGRHAPRPV